MDQNACEQITAALTSVTRVNASHRTQWPPAGVPVPALTQSRLEQQTSIKTLMKSNYNKHPSPLFIVALV